jgi:hypothetical protein
MNTHYTATLFVLLPTLNALGEGDDPYGDPDTK